MKVMKIVLQFAGLAAMLVGCHNEPHIPEVSEANCQIDKIMQITDEDARREFGSQCFRRPVGPDVLPKNPKRW